MPGEGGREGGGVRVTSGKAAKALKALINEQFRQYS